MDLTEVLDRHGAMQATIYSVIRAFEEETGLHVDRVILERSGLTASWLGQRPPKPSLTGVEVIVEL